MFEPALKRIEMIRELRTHRIKAFKLECAASISVHVPPPNRAYQAILNGRNPTDSTLASEVPVPLYIVTHRKCASVRLKMIRKDRSSHQ